MENFDIMDTQAINIPLIGEEAPAFKAPSTK